MDFPPHPDSQKKLANQLKLLFNYLMVGLYICLGFYIAIKGWSTFSRTQSISLGGLLILYAVFRVYRLLRKTESA